MGGCQIGGFELTRKINASEFLREGIYCEYMSNMYLTFFDKGMCDSDSAYLFSRDKKDLLNGFVCEKSERYMSKFGFSCNKIVPKSEITKAYKVRQYANYKDIKCGILGVTENGVRIGVRCNRHNINHKDDEIIEKKVLSWGFTVYMEERDFTIYESLVSPDDPELEIFQVRDEIDISKL